MIKLQEITDDNTPVIMLNMLRFKNRRLYFEEYVPAFNTVMDKLGIMGTKPVLISDVLANIIADKDEYWDAIILVEYPSVKAFKTMFESEEYQILAEPLRIAAIDELKLFMTRKIEL